MSNPGYSLADGGIMGGMRKQLHTKRDAERNARISRVLLGDDTLCAFCLKDFDDEENKKYRRSIEWVVHCMDCGACPCCERCLAKPPASRCTPCFSKRYDT